jgi:hypothetical protein
MVTRHRISRLLGASTAALLFAFASVAVLAQATYPNRPIRVLTPF